MLNFDLMEVYADTCAKYGPDSEQVKLLREAHKDDTDFTKFAYGYDILKRVVGGSGINWVPRFDTPKGTPAPDNPAGCPNPNHHRTIYFKKVAVHQIFRLIGQYGMILAFFVIILGIWKDSVPLMISAVWSAVIAGVVFLAAIVPLMAGDILYLRKKAEKEQGIY